MTPINSTHVLYRLDRLVLNRIKLEFYTKTEISFPTNSFDCKIEKNEVPMLKCAHNTSEYQIFNAIVAFNL